MFTAQIAQLLEIGSSCLLVHSHGSEKGLSPEYFTERQIRKTSLQGDNLHNPFAEAVDDTIDSIFLYACGTATHASELARSTQKTVIATDDLLSQEVESLEAVNAYVVNQPKVLDTDFVRIAETCKTLLTAEEINSLSSKPSLLEETFTNKGTDINAHWGGQIDGLPAAIKNYCNSEPFLDFPDAFGNLYKFHPNGAKEIVPSSEFPQLARKNNLEISDTSQETFVGELPSIDLIFQSRPTTVPTPSTPKMSLVSVVNRTERTPLSG